MTAVTGVPAMVLRTALPLATGAFGRAFFTCLTQQVAAGAVEADVWYHAPNRLLNDIVGIETYEDPGLWSCRAYEFIKTANRTEEKLPTELQPFMQQYEQYARNISEGAINSAWHYLKGALAEAMRIGREAKMITDIQNDPDNPDPRLVYADWLLEQADPRGKMIYEVGMREMEQQLIKEAKAKLASRLKEAARRKEIEIQLNSSVDSPRAIIMNEDGKPHRTIYKTEFGRLVGRKMLRQFDYLNPYYSDQRRSMLEEELSKEINRNKRGKKRVKISYKWKEDQKKPTLFGEVVIKSFELEGVTTESADGQKRELSEDELDLHLSQSHIGQHYRAEKRCRKLMPEFTERLGNELSGGLDFYLHLECQWKMGLLEQVSMDLGMERDFHRAPDGSIIDTTAIEVLSRLFQAKDAAVLQSLTLENIGSNAIEALLYQPQIKGIKHLRIASATLSPDDVQAFVDTPYLSDSTEVHMKISEGRDADIHRLVKISRSRTNMKIALSSYQRSRIILIELEQRMRDGDIPADLPQLLRAIGLRDEALQHTENDSDDNDGPDDIA